MTHARAALAWSTVPMLAVLCTTTRASGQWPNRPTAGLARTTDGAPVLTAPSPRTSGGKPDLSGIWKAKARPCNGCIDPVAEQFLDFGFGLKGGLPYQPWAAQAVRQRMAALGRDDPYSQCLPAGVPRLYVTPSLATKFVQLSGLLIMLSERNASYRQIFLDGRALPADPEPSWIGYSSGRWEGDTLVVETIGLRDGVWLDRNGSPLTDAAHVTERLRRLSVGTLEIEITIDDPKAYTAPWTTTLTELLMPDTELLDAVCLENERDFQRMHVK